MAEQNVASNAAKHDVPDNEIERLLQTVLGKEWLTNGMGSLSPEQLKAAHSLCADSVEAHARQIGALGETKGEISRFLDNLPTKSRDSLNIPLLQQIARNTAQPVKIEITSTTPTSSRVAMQANAAR